MFYTFLYVYISIKVLIKIDKKDTCELKLILRKKSLFLNCSTKKHVFK